MGDIKILKQINNLYFRIFQFHGLSYAVIFVHHNISFITERYINPKPLLA